MKAVFLQNFWPFGTTHNQIKIYGKGNQTKHVKMSHSRSFLPAVKNVFRKVTLKKVLALRPKLNFVFILGIIILTVFNLLTVNFSVATGYKVTTMQKKVASLKDENKRLMLKTAEIGSIANLQNNLLAEKFVPAGSIQYLISSPSTFSMK